MGIHAQPLLNPIYRPHLSKGNRIGLFTGSFDPPHLGHLLVAEQARQSLGLDAIWWCITPINPLKIRTHNSLIKRFDLCKQIIDTKSRIHIPTLLEQDLAIKHSIFFLKRLKEQDNRKFVFIIGSDNLIKFHLWYDWHKIFRLIPIYVYPRHGSSMQYSSCVAGIRFKKYRTSLKHLKCKLTRIKQLKHPLWCVADGIASNRRSKLASRIIRKNA